MFSYVAEVKYAFLSQEWLVHAKRIREECLGVSPMLEYEPIRANLVFTDGPEGQTILAHIAASAAGSNLEFGHIGSADATVETSYRTAKAIFCDMDFAASMEAFMAGEIMVDGDISRLLDLMTQVSDDSPTNQEITRRVREITLD